MNKRHCRNMRDLVFWEWKESSWQEQKTSWEPFNDLALPGRQGWTHFLPYHHKIILQVTAHSGRGGVFSAQGAALVLTNAGLDSPTLQSS